MGKFEIYPDAAGKYRWRLKASNGQIIASGQGYATERSCRDGIESVKKHAASAEVVEVEG
ncbi:MAG TPA: YegP family protein [Propionicimonas sp.]|nr:YegP family protein [Propionicimonas sp.]HQA77011.1 YegP family protein [Propionicimonas sp.]HQD96152.1 YegP family protein [Propionicimonas sp.]